MKHLNEFVLEQLDDNFMWKLDRWFGDDTEEYSNILRNYKNGSTVVDSIKGTSLEKDIKSFVDFMNDDSSVENVDYEYNLSKIFDLTMADKSENNIYSIE